MAMNTQWMAGLCLILALTGLPAQAQSSMACTGRTAIFTQQVEDQISADIFADVMAAIAKHQAAILSAPDLSIEVAALAGPRVELKRAFTINSPRSDQQLQASLENLLKIQGASRVSLAIVREECSR